MTRYRQHLTRPPKQESFLETEVSRGLISILLFIIAGLSILSFFSMAGVVGTFIDWTLAFLFGQVRYVFPFLLLTTGVLLIKDLEYSYRSTHLIGSVLFFLSVNGLIHIQKPADQMVNLATQGYGGGVAGLILAWPLATYVSYWGGLLILTGLFITSIIFLFNTSLAHLVELNKKAFLMLGWGGRQVVSFFESFKKDKVKFSIKGDFDKPDDTNIEPDVETAEVDEEERFTIKKISKVEQQSEEEEVNEPGEERKFSNRKVSEATEPVSENETKNEESIVISKPNLNYKLPTLDLLRISKGKPTSGDIKSNAETIRSTLKNFGIEVEMGEVRVGPTVTQYSLKPYDGIKLSRITGLSDNLALALAAHPIRIEAPIPGQSLVGIEVPNQKVAMVSVRELLESNEFKNREHNMMIALGKDVAGKVNVADLTRMPHLLVAGTTNSGKTVCVNTLIMSLLFQNTPETLRLIMIDPKQVEFTIYNGIPHLLTPVITDPNKVVNALRWAIGEMERRFGVMSSVFARDIASYNKKADEKMPYIVIVIDELADLMITTAAEVEAGIVRLAQKARAVGIHLIVATQRPSVEVITGLMKANMPGRIAFKVNSVIDSRTILDSPGADKLLGRGDMLYQTQEMSKPKRLQGAFVTEDEIKDVVKHIRGDEPPQYDESIISKPGGGTMNLFGGPSDDVDPMFEEVKNEVLNTKKASASYLQRRFQLGYARAARILDQLEEAGIVGPANGAKPREVFTEHLMNRTEEELPEDEQTMDSGGTVLSNPNNEGN